MFSALRAAGLRSAPRHKKAPRSEALGGPGGVGRVQGNPESPRLRRWKSSPEVADQSKEKRRLQMSADVSALCAARIKGSERCVKHNWSLAGLPVEGSDYVRSPDHNVQGGL